MKKYIILAILSFAFVFGMPQLANANTLVHRVNEAFRSVFNRNPNQAENAYWVTRVGPQDKNTFNALQGAMAYHRSLGQSMPAIRQVVPLNQRVNEAFRSIFRRNPTQVENTYWLGRIGPNDKNTFAALQGAMAYHQALGRTMGDPVDTRPLTHRVNEAFRNVFGRNPNQAENAYWVKRVGPHDKNTFNALQGAMAFHNAQGNTMGNPPGQVAGSSLPRSGDDRDSLIKVVLPLFFHLYGNDPSEAEKDWWRRRIRCSEITTYNGLVNSMAYHKAHNARIGGNNICGQAGTVIKGSVNGLGNHPMGPPVRVGLYSTNGSAIHVTANGSFQIREGQSKILHTLNAGQVAEVSWSGGKYHIKGPGINTSVSGDVRLVPLNMAVMELKGFADNANIVPFPNKQYNKFRGIIEIRKCRTYVGSTRTFNCNLGSHGSNSLWAINELRVEYYVRGLAETSGNGPVEYLRSLGIAARTYALYHKVVTGGRYPAEGFDITNTPNDQIYRGYEYEKLTPRMTSIFADTKGIVITNGRGTMAVPVYFSDSDGFTRHFPDPAARFAHLHHSVADPHNQGRTCGIGGNHCYGMSAQGAYGFALHDGWSFAKILNYYYKNIQLVQAY